MFKFYYTFALQFLVIEFFLTSVWGNAGWFVFPEFNLFCFVIGHHACCMGACTVVCEGETCSELKSCNKERRKHRELHGDGQITRGDPKITGIYFYYFLLCIFIELYISPLQSIVHVH
jgi:hypothetical protein